MSRKDTHFSPSRDRGDTRVAVRLDHTRLLRVFKGGVIPFWAIHSGDPFDS
jgi:hypothetical protein